MTLFAESNLVKGPFELVREVEPVNVIKDAPNALSQQKIHHFIKLKQGSAAARFDGEGFRPPGLGEALVKRQEVLADESRHACLLVAMGELKLRDFQHGLKKLLEAHEAVRGYRAKDQV